VKPLLTIRCPHGHAIGWVDHDRQFDGRPVRPTPIANSEAEADHDPAGPRETAELMVNKGRLGRTGLRPPTATVEQWRAFRAGERHPPVHQPATLPGWPIGTHRVGCRCGAWRVRDRAMTEAVNAGRATLTLTSADAAAQRAS
jgi:hypothetical protein